MKCIDEFKASNNAAYLKIFISSPTGMMLMEILRTAAEPKKNEDAKQMATGQDFVMQLALAHNYRLAQHEMIRLIFNLSEPPNKPKAPEVKPEEGMALEPEDVGDGKPEKMPNK